MYFSGPLSMVYFFIRPFIRSGGDKYEMLLPNLLSNGRDRLISLTDLANQLVLSTVGTA